MQFRNFRIYNSRSQNDGTVTPLNALIFINVAFYILQILPVSGAFLTATFPLIPALAFQKFEIWRFLSYSVVHVSPLHILFNMLTLWSIGRALQNIWSQKKIVMLYLLATFCVSLFSFPFPDSILFGSSGGILAIITAYAFYFPREKILLLFVFPVPARISIIILGGFSIALSITGQITPIYLCEFIGVFATIGFIYFEKKVIPAYLKNMETREAAKSIMREQSRLSQSEQVDLILKKIGEGGMDSLSNDEREILKRASDKKGTDKDSDKIVPFRSPKY